MTSTRPSRRATAPGPPPRGSDIVFVTGVHVKGGAGSNTSPLFSIVLLAPVPPATSTFPLGSMDAAARSRAVPMSPGREEPVRYRVVDVRRLDRRARGVAPACDQDPAGA